MAHMSNRRRMPDGTEAPCLQCSVMRHRRTNSDVAVDNASAMLLMQNRSLCIAIKLAKLATGRSAVETGVGHGVAICRGAL